MEIRIGDSVPVLRTLPLNHTQIPNINSLFINHNHTITHHPLNIKA